MVGHPGLALHHQAGHPVEMFGREAGFPLHTPRGESTRILRERGKTKGVIFHEILVVRARLDEAPRQPPGQGRVDPGRELNEEIRLFGRRGSPGIHHDHPGAPFPRPLDGPGVGRVAVVEVGAPEDDGPGVLEIGPGVVVAMRQEMGDVAGGEAEGFRGEVVGSSERWKDRYLSIAIRT